MAFNRQCQRLGAHAVAIIFDQNKRLPPLPRLTSICVAPASMAFSTSSFTALAGRSTTSPAAMRLMVLRAGGEFSHYFAAISDR